MNIVDKFVYSLGKWKKKCVCEREEEEGRKKRHRRNTPTPFPPSQSSLTYLLAYSLIFNYLLTHSLLDCVCSFASPAGLLKGKAGISQS